MNERWAGQGLRVRERAERSWQIRHNARRDARANLADSSDVDLLKERDISTYGSAGGPTFDFLIKRLNDAGLAGDAVYETIIDQASRTDAGLSRRLDS